MDIMISLLDSKNKLYEGCEAVMEILTQASVMKTVESVVESWISVLEHHSSKTRDLSSTAVQNKLMIAINGPLSQHSRSIVEESMRVYWSKLKSKKLRSGHFT